MPTSTAISRRKPPPERTRWKPGQSGNPKGRKKGQPTLTGALIKALKEAQTNNDIPKLRDVAIGLLKRAAKGDPRAADLIWCRLDGKVAERLIQDDALIITVHRENPNV